MRKPTPIELAYHFFITRWALWIAVIVFVLFKLPALHYLFYWDESWSYEPAIKLMYHHGPSLMPNAIDTNFSRGHPLLFYFSVAAWMKLFGPQAISQHAFSLTVFVLLIITVYEVCRHFFNERTALLSLAIVPLQAILFVQSTMMLPEIMLALLALLSICFYIKKKYFLTFFFLSATMLTKESGMVIGLLLGIDSTIRLFNNNYLLKDRAYNFLSVLFASFVIIGFFVLQKALNGWFLFPEHIGLISFKWEHCWGAIKCALGVLFINDARTHLYQVVIFFALMTTIQTRKIKFLLPVLIALLVYMCVNEVYDDIPRQVITFILVIAVWAMSAQMLSFTTKEQKSTKQFIRIGTAYLIAYVAFCSINFYTERYTISALIISVIFTAYYLDRMIAMYYDPIFIIVIVIIILTGQYSINNSKEVHKTFDGMAVQKDIVDHMKMNNYYNEIITAGSYQDVVHLGDINTGYLDSTNFKHVTWSINDQTQIIIFNNIEKDYRYAEVLKDTSFKLVYRSAHGEIWGEIYKRKQ